MTRFYFSSLSISLSLLLLLSLSFSSVSALYSPSDDVIELTASNFDKQVLKSDGIWFVEFYAPWCGHCKNLAPEWKKAATALKGVVNIAGVDMTQHQSVGGPYDVKGFPTIKIFGLDKKKPTDYNGAREASAIIKAALSEAQSVVNARASGKKGSSGGSSGGSKGSSGGASKVVTVTESNFEAEVLQSEELVLVEFFAPWCGHCKNLAPHWEEAAKSLSKTAKLAAVDATVHTSLASKYGIKGYPTIKVFRPGSKDKPVDYEGARTADAIIQYAKNLAEVAAPPKEVKELNTEEDLNQACVEESSLCLVSFLPHILDSKKAGREQYLAVQKELAKKYSRRPFGYVWVEAGSQPGLEEALGVGGAFYPTLVVLSLKKNKYTPMVGAYSVESISEFLKRVLDGKEHSLDLNQRAPLVKTEKWDGQEGKAYVEEDEEGGTKDEL